MSHFLTADDITNGKTLTFTDLDPFADEIYVAAFADLYDDEGLEGDLVEVYQDVDVAEALSGKQMQQTWSRNSGNHYGSGISYAIRVEYNKVILVIFIRLP